MPNKSTKQNKAGMSVRLSMAMENYLLSIFRLQEEDNSVTVTQLAEHLKILPEAEGLGTSLPSVGAMVKLSLIHI